MAVLTDEEEEAETKETGDQDKTTTEELANETLDAVEANKEALNKFVKEWITRMHFQEDNEKTTTENQQISLWVSCVTLLQSILMLYVVLHTLSTLNKRKYFYTYVLLALNHYWFNLHFLTTFRSYFH